MPINITKFDLFVLEIYIQIDYSDERIAAAQTNEHDKQ